jgi:uncharacterized protein YbjT (DUF2867 family)
MSGPSHLVVGAGPVGRQVARTLAQRGDAVTVASRRGTRLPGTQGVAADASDAAALTAAAAGAATIFLCTNPAVYSAEEWQRAWPPIDASESERMLGVTATPWETALRDTAQSYRRVFNSPER